VREGINKVSEKEKEKAKKFKEYDPGYLHINLTYFPKINGMVEKANDIIKQRHN